MERYKLKQSIRAYASVAVIALAAASFAGGDRCESATTTAEMRECATRRLEAARSELESVYTKLAHALEPRRLEKMIASQEAWGTFRDRQADFAASAVEGGTLYYVLHASELAYLTERRIAELRMQLPPDSDAPSAIADPPSTAAE